MDPAWIGLGGGIIGTATSGFIALRQARDSERLARLNGELQEEVARLEGRIQADLARLGRGVARDPEPAPLRHGRSRTNS